ncbi:YggT family protein [Candidatus Erwinia haradaeae]|uniref:Uncharacterized protein YggT n=1 Tax=Candidatus Erwinia haradaeae TaxID=1922217 RepID=A0A451DPI9_9GAMM|nr:YggT family protein [Candidatus Erwinia haradaeae]VFP88683.1 Uncharacterized protein YggT [Candidatus Erwinia haradaeae]
MLALIFLITIIITTYVKVLLLHIWLQWVNCDCYNPLSQLIIKMTRPVLDPFRRIFKYSGSWDIIALFIAYIISVISAPVTLKLFHLESVFFYFGLVILLKACGTLIFWVIMSRSLTGWVNYGNNAIDYVLIQLTEPLLIPIRRLMSPVSGFDFSIMVVMMILYMLNFLGAEYIPGWINF